MPCVETSGQQAVPQKLFCLDAASCAAWLQSRQASRRQAKRCLAAKQADTSQVGAARPALPYTAHPHSRNCAPVEEAGDELGLTGLVLIKLRGPGQGREG